MNNKNVFRSRHFLICFAILLVLVSIDIISYRMELNSVSGKSVERQDPAGKEKPVVHLNKTGIPAKDFSAVVVDDDNIKWFITEAGIVSFNGKRWKLHNKNGRVATRNLKDFVYEPDSHGPKLWIASPVGVTVARLPVNSRTDATTYHTENSSILSKNVAHVALGKNTLLWFGTDRGVSALRNDKWLSMSYTNIYPERMFRDFPIISMAANLNGDSLYIGTEGAGVARVYRNVDAISGASVYAKWGPIFLPSDKIYSIFIANDGSQWFGTDQGIARHKGNKTLGNWKVFDTNDGLVNNFVQAIAADRSGKLWFGTRGGVSVFDGSVWTSYTMNDGLNSNNVLCIAVDNDGVVWLGTDNGVTCYKSGKLISYY
jgi:hypothetical protein